MADQAVPIPVSGSAPLFKVDTAEITNSAGVVTERQRVVLADNLDPLAFGLVNRRGEQTTYSSAYDDLVRLVERMLQEQRKTNLLLANAYNLSIDDTSDLGAPE